MIDTNVQSHVYIDWDYQLGDTVDYTTSGDDITEYRMAASIRVGGQSGARTANVGTCEITLLNDDRRFSPRNTTSTLYGKLLPMKPVKITATNGADTWVVFTGWTWKIAPQPDKHGSRQATISCIDNMGLLQASNIDIPLREDVLSSQLAKDVINYALKAPIANGWFAFVGNLSDNETVTVNGTVYRAKTTPAQVNDFQIGASASTGRYDTIRALVAAINGWDNGGLYFTGTTRPTGVGARLNDSSYQIIQDSAPVRYYRFGEAAGTTAYDLGGNGANGTYVGSPTLGVTGAITADSDTAISLDGTARYVSIPSLDISNRSFAISFWFNPDATPPNNQDLFSAFSAFAANQAFYIRYNSSGNGIVSAEFYSGAQVTSGTLTAGTWYLISVVYDYSGGLLTLYINGAVVDFTNLAGPYTGATPTMQIAAFTAAGATYVKGDMDDFALWLRLVDADELLDQYTARASAPYPGVYIFSLLRGVIGNSYTLAEATTNVAITGANLTGGADTTLAGLSIETGLRTFPYAGDGWEGDTMNALSAIGQIVDSERGRFYVKRDGTATFENYAKGFTTYSTTPALVTSGLFNNDTVVTLEGVLSADEAWNAVTVRYKPRTELTTGVVAKASSTIKVPGRWGTQSSDPNRDKPWFDNGRPVGDPGQTVITLPYTDPDTGQRIGAKDLTAPLVATTDWTANEAQDGTGTDYTTYSPQQLFFTLAPKASAVDVYIKNTALGILYIRHLQVRGTKLLRYNTETIIREDVDSIALYGRNNMQIGLPLESDANFATAIAEYELSRNSTPLWRPRIAGFRNLTQDDTGNKVLDVELGDVILIHEYQAMVAADQVRLRIVGVSYEFGNLNEFETTFDVDIIDDKLYGIYGATNAVFDSVNYTI